MIRFPIAALTISVCLVVLLFTAGESFALPKCPGSYNENTWTNCSGTHTSADGTKYVGEWRNDKAHGQGTTTFADGNKYVGEYRDGSYHGQGAFTFADGSGYVGEWRDGRPNGQGTKTFADGTVQEGIYKDGEFKYAQKASSTVTALPPCPKDQSQRFHNCVGTGTYEDGGEYVGEWRDNKYHGQGTFTFGPSTQWAGEKYVGEWKDDAFHGQGTYTFADGTVQEGIWKNHEFQYARKDPKVEERRKVEREAERRKQERIAREHTAPPELDAIDAPYVALKNANVREQPDAKSPHVTTLSKGSEITALGKVKGKNWYLVSRDGKKLGYVFGPLLSELGTERIGKEEERRKVEREAECPGSPQTDGFVKNWHNCKGTYISTRAQVLGDGQKVAKFSAGGKYVGEWQNNMPNGQGTHTSADGYKYVGEVRDDKQHGQGTATYASGDKYVGEWKDGEPNGHGTGTYVSGREAGRKYVGEWKEGYWHGQGTRTDASGDVWEGIWENGAWAYSKEDPKREEKRKAERKPEKIESQRSEAANDNTRLALDVLNYTLKGDKSSRDGAIAASTQECTFYVFDMFGKQTLYVDNIIPNTVKFYSKQFYNELFQLWQERYYVEFSGDERVWNDSSSAEIFLHTDADLERVQKAWGMLFSKACEGASPSEF